MPRSIKAFNAKQSVKVLSSFLGIYWCYVKNWAIFYDMIVDGQANQSQFWSRRATMSLFMSSSSSLTPKWCFLGLIKRSAVHAFDSHFAWSRNTGLSSGPTHTVTGQSGRAINAGLSAMASFSVIRKASFIAVWRNWLRSLTGDIGITWLIRSGISVGKRSPTAMRATRWPPAEWPAKAIFPKVRFATFVTALAICWLMSLIRTTG